MRTSVRKASSTEVPGGKVQEPYASVTRIA